MIISTKTKKWIGLLIYPFFVFTGWSANGQTALPKSYEDVLNLKFQETTTLSASELANTPHFSLYLDNLREVTYLIFTENKEAFDSLKKNEKARIRALKEVKTSSPYTEFIRAEIKIQWAFTKLKFGQQWNAVWSLRSAYRTIRRNIEDYPDFELNYKSLGLLHVIFGAVPEGYQWALGLLGLEGDTQKGLDELYILLKKGSVFQPEVRLIAALVESYLMEDHQAALDLIEASSASATYAEQYALALVLMKSHQSAKAITVLEQSLAGLEGAKAAPLFHYLLAEALFQEGSYERSTLQYGLFVRYFQGNNNLKDAHYKTALCQLFRGNEKRAEVLFDIARSIEEENTESDKNAGKLLKTMPSPVLLQIRFAIDGGFYSRADSLLKSQKVAEFSAYEQFELVYRKARLNHLQMNYEEAIRLYRQVIARDKEIPETYFVPNSFLQLGYLQLEQGNVVMARDYFKKVLTFRKHPYKSSLDSKAKIALKGLPESGD